MTPKQQERFQAKIKKIKAALAADKKRWCGYYHDGQGFRYMPPKLFIQLGDYSGGLRYLNWFNKNFPDDIAYPEFLFEWTIILYKTGRLKEAEKKAFNAFCANTYIIDKFFGKPIVPIDKYENSNIDIPEYTEHFDYSCNQEQLADFAEWLKQFVESEKFIQLSDKFIDIYKRVKSENDNETRRNLLNQADQLENEF